MHKPLPGHPWPFQDHPQPPSPEELWPFVRTADPAARPPALGSPSELLARSLGLWACPTDMHTHSHKHVRVHTHSTLTLPSRPHTLGPRLSHPVAWGLDTQLSPCPRLLTLTPAQSPPNMTWQPGVSFSRRRGLCPPGVGRGLSPSSAPYNGHCHSLRAFRVPGQLPHRETPFLRLWFRMPEGSTGPSAGVWGRVRNWECCGPVPASVSSSWACGALGLGLTLLRGKPRPGLAR